MNIFNIFKAKLLKVDARAADKGGLNIRLIFESEKLDRGLEQMVPCSQPVKLDPDHHHLAEFYKCYIGKELYLPVSLSAMEGNIFYKTIGDGKPLQLEEKKTPELSKEVGAKS
ncbi:hypothetical protein [Acinetobacter gerneri]|uniref:hypothetical protein n=1 Tax=Acinetobacter gerneri TaxID=202952 RepID=UPI00321228E4